MPEDVLQTMEVGKHGYEDQDFMTILDGKWNMSDCNLREEIGTPV